MITSFASKGDRMKTLTSALTLTLAGTLAAGCSLVVDGAIQDMDGGMIVAEDCAGAADGTACSGGRICVGEVCVLSRCGDRVVDPATGEHCDDGNDVADDGCEADCFFSCSSSDDCDDGLPCSGAETCSAEHVCQAGEPLASGAACTQPSGDPGACREADCVAAGCGNALPDAGEDCDDGNAEDGDGCDVDCTFSCTTDAECDDASICTGTETCNLATHACETGTALACDDGDACTSNDCDAVAGCVYPLIDADMDGHASTDLGACGDDCNDGRADVSPSAVELCGDTLDSDCDGVNDPASTPFWYLDCDGDTYAPAGAASQQRCDEPPPSPCGGGWTTRVPVVGDRTTYDCNDGNANVRPNQTTYSSTAIAGASSSVDYDYNCDLVETREYTATRVSSTGSCLYYRDICTGAAGWTGTSAPVCGGTGTYTSCGPTLCIPPCTPNPCARRSLTRTQRCR